MSQIPAPSFGTNRPAFAVTQGLRSRTGWVFPVDSTRSKVAALVSELSEHLLHAPTATGALHTWCAARSLSAGPITVVKQSPNQPCYPDDDGLDELRPDRHERIVYRRVRLVRGPLVLSEADNWFVPDRLPPAIRELLEASDVPFGTAIAQLQPSRRTYFVGFAEFSAAWQVGAKDSSLVLSPAMTVLEHKAVVLDRDGRPLSVVSERYRAALLGGVEAPFTSVH
jgi:hypothetical protein